MRDIEKSGVAETKSNPNQTSNRKLDHIRICLEEEVESDYSGLEEIKFVNNPLPELDFNDITTEVVFLGKKLSAPFLIASMTGGHPDTTEINRNLAVAVEESGIGMGVGSQRAALEDRGLEKLELEELERSFTVVREFAPNAFIYANIGLPQILQHGIEYAEKAVEMIDADAIAIHLNFMQEVIQPEGDVNARNGLKAIREVTESLKVPVIVKETGGGVAAFVAEKIRDIGADAIDVGGAGGTSWIGVEVYRTEDEISKKIGYEFWDWGLPTAFSIVECRNYLPLIATGGIRSGLDVAKSIAIGAEIGSAALPFLSPATRSSDEVLKLIEFFIRGLKIAMFLTGCRKIKELRNRQLIVHGRFKDYLEVKGIDVQKFCRNREV
ncbi:type 2 isopentenyl-diphosphate Delta-isomerase [Archaeoglobales archaeon]|nr:MAG: type 2 isopentenyl-diphosphate Delta-isomerase [Archaeoglobales archaeon]